MNYLNDVFICSDTFVERRDALLTTVNLLLKQRFSSSSKITADSSTEN